MSAKGLSIMRDRLTGIIAATFTPMDENGDLNLDRVGAIVDHLHRDGVSGLYVGGTTGEGMSLTVQERRDVAAAYVQAAKGRLPVLVHVGHNSLREARSLAEHARQIGATAISAVPPSYFKPASVEALVSSLAEVAAGAPGLPFYYYHIPALSGVSLDMVEFLHVAAERLPTLAGLKFTSPVLHEFQACLEFAKDRFDVLFGLDEMLLSALSVGARGAVGSTYNFAMPLYRRILEAFARGDLAEARRFQARSVAMIRVLSRYRGMPGFKAAMRLIGQDCGPTRLPLVSLTTGEMAAMREELAATGFFEWAQQRF